MKKLSIFIPLAFFVLTGCANGGTTSSNSNSSTQVTSGGVTSVTSSTSSSSSTTSVAPTNLEIVQQPVSKTINFGDPVDFELKVNSESLVKSYQWELLNVEDESGYPVWVEIHCECARTNKLHIPGPSFSGERPYRCKITDIKNQVIYSDEVKYIFSDYYEGMSYIDVGTRIVRQGQSLDLSTTPFGSGKVSINEEGNKLTLDNVHFNNINTDYDPFDSDVALYFMNYKYAEETFTVELKGENVIYNSYYEEDTKQGGLDLAFFFSGRGTNPVITIGGNGTLSAFGGSVGIYANTKLVIDANMSFKSIADHWSGAIHAQKLVIEENIIITADVSMYLFEVNNKGNDTPGEITIKTGAYISANLSPVQDSTHGSALSQAIVISATHKIHIDGATLDINLVNDYKRLEDGNFLPPVEVMTTHYNSDIEIINESVININVTTVNVNDDSITMMLNGIVAAGDLYISKSTVNLTANTPHCERFVGILGNNITTFKSSINVDIKAISATGFASNNGMEINESDLVVKVNSMAREGEGVVAKTTLQLPLSYVLVSINQGIALGVYFANGEEERKYDSMYICQHLIIGDDFISRGTVRPNIYSKPRTSSGYQYYETIYDTSDTENPLTEFIYNAK